MSNNYNLCIEKLLFFEGGYANHPLDTGGETYKGISRNNFPYWKGWKIIDNLKLFDGFPNNLENEDLNNLVKEFYYAEFWLKLKCDKIDNINIQYELFDFGVNSGIKNAIKTLQRTLNLLSKNVIEEDGIFGNNTMNNLLRLIEKKEEELFLKWYNILKGEYYYLITIKRPENKNFIRGWSRRIHLDYESIF